MPEHARAIAASGNGRITTVLESVAQTQRLQTVLIALVVMLAMGLGAALWVAVTRQRSIDESLASMNANIARILVDNTEMRADLHATREDANAFLSEVKDLVGHLHATKYGAHDQ